MTVTDSTASGGSSRVRVRDQDGPLEFDGTMVADLSWTYDMAKTYGHTRWTDLTLYRVTQEGSQYEYVLQVVGRSLLYHSVNGLCRSGINLTVGMVYQDTERYEALEACKQCNPPDLDDLDLSAMVSVEEDLPTLYRCRDAAEFLAVMEERISRERNRNGLSRKLLKVASNVDAAIAEEQMKNRSL